MHRETLSSNDFAQPGFRPHGEFHCHLEGDILMWVSRGPFNLEALQAYGKVRRAAFERWDLGARPVGAVMASQHTLAAVAWVGNPDLVEGLDVMHEHYVPLFERHGLPFRVFDEAGPAIAWVRQVLQRARQAQGE
jgi:hypothetical protein